MNTPALSKRYLKLGRWLFVDLREGVSLRLFGHPRTFCLEVAVSKESSAYYRWWTEADKSLRRLVWWFGQREGFRVSLNNPRLHFHVHYLPPNPDEIG